MKSKVLVLLSTYNGEKYLEELMDSVLSQVDVEVHMLIRDDVSKDNTREILEKYAARNKNIKIIFGDKNLGCPRSFWELIQHADGYEYYALCDQDDVWLPEKLAEAVKMIKNSKTSVNVPALYTSAVRAIDGDGEVLSDNMFETEGVINAFESMQRSIVPGCVMVFNDRAIKRLKRYHGYMEAQDWAIYAIVNLFGKVLYDKRSFINYRIHEGNLFGADKGAALARKRLKRFFGESKHTREKMAKDIYDTYSGDIPEKYRESVRNMGYYREGLRGRLKLAFDRNYSGMVFKFYALIGKI